MGDDIYWRVKATQRVVYHLYFDRFGQHPWKHGPPPGNLIDTEPDRHSNWCNCINCREYRFALRQRKQKELGNKSAACDAEFHSFCAKIAKDPFGPFEEGEESEAPDSEAEE